MSCEIWDTRMSAWNVSNLKSSSLTSDECTLPNTFHAIGDENGGRDQSCQKEHHSKAELTSLNIRLCWNSIEISPLTSWSHQAQRILENRLQTMNKRVFWNWLELWRALWAVHSRPSTFEQIDRTFHVIYAPRNTQLVDLTYPIELESHDFQTIHFGHLDYCPKYPWLIRWNLVQNVQIQWYSLFLPPHTLPLSN